MLCFLLTGFESFYMTPFLRLFYNAMIKKVTNLFILKYLLLKEDLSNFKCHFKKAIFDRKFVKETSNYKAND